MHKRQALKDDNFPLADEYADCDACMGRATDAQRASMRCGWMPEHEWAPGQMPIPDGCSVEPECCPGYLITIPQVVEAARASSWRQDGALREFYDGGTISDLCKFAIDTFLAETKGIEAHIMRKQRESMSNGSR